MPTNDNMVNCLLEHAVRSPDKVAFIILENPEEPGKTISYLELRSKVETLAFQLSGKQLKDKRVLLVYQDILDFIVSFMACHYSGIIPVPVSYVKGNKQLVRVMNIIGDAEVSAILCNNYSVPDLQESLYSLPGPDDPEIIPTDPIPVLNESRIIQKPVYNPTAFIQYTSGSTGKPKGVVITHKGLMHNQQLLKDTFKCNTGSVILSWLPFHHDMGLIGNVLHAIYVGCTCVLMSPLHFIKRPGIWLDAISKYKVTHSGGPNFAYDLCLERIPASELSRLDLASWIVAYNGAEPVRAETIRQFSSYFKPAGFRESSFYPCYGLAEATLLVSGYKKEQAPLIIFIDGGPVVNGRIILSDEPNSGARVIVSSGGVATGMDCKIISLHAQKECKELEEGEICISGDSVTTGYWNKDNVGVFCEIGGKRFLRTGDTGFTYRNELFVHGRIKEMLIVRGRNIYPYDMEKTAAGSNIAIQTNGVAIFCLDDKEEDFVIVAEIKRNFLKELDVATVIQAINNTVSGSFGIAPYDIVLTTPFGIPRTTSGKLQRIQCMENYRDNAFTIIGSKLQFPGISVKKEKNGLLLKRVIENGDYEAIRAYLIDIVECKVGHLKQELWSDKLEFTDIGVDSIRSMELINIINKDLNINIDAAKSLRDNTLSALVHVIENMLWLKTKRSSEKQITI